MQEEATVGEESTKTIPKISVIMPAFNVAGKIARTLRMTRDQLNGDPHPHEIIVVDDGSTDTTLREASSLKDRCVTVVGYGRNHGKGYAVRYGSRLASGDFVVLMDSDGNITPDLIQRYIGALDEYDIAIASKWHPESRVSAPVLRRFLSHAFHFLAVSLTGIRVSDTQCGFKAFRREAFDRIISLLSVKQYAFDVEVLTVAKLLNLKVTELPVRMTLSSHFKFKKVIRMLVDLVGITYRLHVIHWYQCNLRNQNARYRPIIKW